MTDFNNYIVAAQNLATLSALSVAAIKFSCVQLLGHVRHDVRWAIVCAVPHKHLKSLPVTESPPKHVVFAPTDLSLESI